VLQQWSDLWLCEPALRDSVLFPGPSPLPEEAVDDAHALLELTRRSAQDDFVLDFQGRRWRVQHDRLSLGGPWWRLRQLPTVAPTLDSLPSPLPAAVVQALMAPGLRSGGLVLITGPAGAGKTTTASAVLASRLRAFGGAACTIEDPPEMPLAGWHGPGWCSQAAVAGERPEDWTEAFRCALRSQPVATPAMLLVGELRLAEAARMSLRAASNGFLVLTTAFGSDLPSALQALARLAGDAGDTLLASLLRVAIFQRLEHGRLSAQMLVSTGPATPLAARIRAGQWSHLASDLMVQAATTQAPSKPAEVSR
jgi:twitching motility protein PilT